MFYVYQGGKIRAEGVKFYDDDDDQLHLVDKEKVLTYFLALLLDVFTPSTHEEGTRKYR